MKKCYQDERCYMRSGDLIAWDKSGGGLISKLTIFFIKLFTGSRYGHVGVLWVKGGRVFVIEAAQPYVRITPVSALKEFFHIPTRVRWLKQYEEFLLSKVGLKYSLMDCIRAYFGTLNNKDNNRYQCAELACEFYKLANILEEDYYEPGCLVNAIIEKRKSQPILITKQPNF